MTDREFVWFRLKGTVKLFFLLYLALLLAGIVIVRAILPMRIHWGWKAGMSAVVLAVACKFQILHFFGGGMFFAPDLPVPVLLVSSWLFAVFFLFAVLLIAADIVRGGWILYYAFRKQKRPESFRIINNRVNLALLGAALLLGTFGVWNGRRIPAVRERTVVLENLPTEADGMRIAVLADFHVDGLTGTGFIEGIVKRTNAQHPDLILILGDFVDGSVALRGRELLPLKELSARYGVYGIPGNHEYYSGYEEWMKFLPTLGIRMLPNSHVMLLNGKLSLAGVTDPVALIRGGELPDVEKALKGIPPGTAKILMAHQPRLAVKAASEGVDLQLSGHTHGGIILGLDLLVKQYNGGFVSGSYRVGDMVLYVSNGSGIWNGFPVRLGVPSEITVLKLLRGK